MSSPFSHIETFDVEPVSKRVVEVYRPGQRAWWIGERDGWICGICQLPIDPDYWISRLGPGFDSLRPKLKPEVDHVIPRHWGGSDEDQNVQTAHAACNGHKHYDPQLPIAEARRYLEWQLGLVGDHAPDVPYHYPGPPGGSQRLALEAAVERGEPGPMYFFAKSLLKHDPERSEQLFRDAAELGYVPPRRELPLLHLRGRPDLALLFRDNQRAALEAAVERGDPGSARDLAWILGKQDSERSEQLFRRAAELGDYEALVDWGLLLKERDPQRATELFEAAAQRGSPGGMYYLGLMLYPSDKNLGLSWLERAAAGGFRRATGTLALRELRGEESPMTQALLLRRRPGVSDARPQAQKSSSALDRSPDQPDPNVTLRDDIAGDDRSRELSEPRPRVLSHLRNRVRRWWR